MEHIRIRACLPDDIDGVIALERLWEQEDIAYGDFNPMSREAYVSILERFPEYFLVAESDRHLVGYIHGSVQRDKPVEIIPTQEPYADGLLYPRAGRRSRHAAHGRLFFSATHAPHDNIGGLAVAERWRRQGVARTLVMHCFQLIQPPAELSVIIFGEDHVAGRPARQCYARMGFQAAEAAPNGLEGGTRQVFRLQLV